MAKRFKLTRRRSRRIFKKGLRTKSSNYPRLSLYRGGKRM